MYELSFMFGRGDINGNGLCKLTTTLSGSQFLCPPLPHPPLLSSRVRRLLMSPALFISFFLSADIAPVTLFSGYPCEPSSPCTLKNGWAGNYAFLRVTTDVGPFSATTAAGSLTITTDWDCSGITAGQSAKIHSADNYYLMRKD